MSAPSAGVLRGSSSLESAERYRPVTSRARLNGGRYRPVTSPFRGQRSRPRGLLPVARGSSMVGMRTIGGASLLALAAALVAACNPTPFREVAVDLSGPATRQAGRDGGEAPVLRFSVAAMESPRDTYATYSRLFERMGARLGVRIDFVQRRTYKEVNDLLANGQLDAALVCTGGYLDLTRRSPGAVEALVVPVVQGRSTYRSLVIVRADSPVTELRQLAGKSFAFTDELSFSGRAWVVDALAQQGLSPETFFASTLLTHSHDRSIEAVAKGLVDAASVHSLIYEHLVRSDATLRERTRVIQSSPEFGLMPLVASTRLTPEQRGRLRAVLIGLSDDDEGGAALKVLEIERFAAPAPGLFDSAARVLEARR